MTNISIIILIFIFFGLFYHITSYLIFKHEFGKPNNASNNTRADYPFISILKPVKGLDDQLGKNLKSFFELDYPHYEIIFGVQSSNDPAIAIINNIINCYPGIKSRLVVNDNKIGLNPKINNLYNMLPYAKGEVLLISDSNTRVEANFLKIMIKEMNNPKVGLVTATIRGKGATNTISLMENMHLGSFLATNVFAVAKLSGIKIVVGKAILIPKSVLEKVGGFKTFKDYLAEDHFMGVKVKELGYEIKNSRVFVDNINEKLGIDKFLNRHTRWAKIRYQIRKSTYLLEILSNPIFNSFVLAVLLHNNSGILQFILVSSFKSLIDYLSLRIMQTDIKIYQLPIIPMKDLILGFLWFVPFMNSTVNWRNNYFKIQKNTLLEPILLKM